MSCHFWRYDKRNRQYHVVCIHTSGRIELLFNHIRMSAITIFPHSIYICLYSTTIEPTYSSTKALMNSKPSQRKKIPFPSHTCTINMIIIRGVWRHAYWPTQKLLYYVTIASIIQSQVSKHSMRSNTALTQFKLDITGSDLLLLVWQAELYFSLVSGKPKKKVVKLIEKSHDGI